MIICCHLFPQLWNSCILQKSPSLLCAAYIYSLVHKQEFNQWEVLTPSLATSNIAHAIWDLLHSLSISMPHQWCPDGHAWKIIYCLYWYSDSLPFPRNRCSRCLTSSWISCMLIHTWEKREFYMHDVFLPGIYWARRGNCGSDQGFCCDWVTIPKTVKDLQRLLGFCKFLSLLKKRLKYLAWNTAAEEALS